MVKRIGFDLDGIFIDKPPFVPQAFIEWLYRDNSKKGLSYRFPSFFEQKIRQISHLPGIRPPIYKNCNLVKEFSKKGKYDFYIISGRFQFLEQLTYSWLKSNDLTKIFKRIYLNIKNEQPHLFKEFILSKIKLNFYVEDDFDTVVYLAGRLRNIHFYWLTQKNETVLNIKNITAINDLEKLLD